MCLSDQFRKLTQRVLPKEFQRDFNDDMGEGHSDFDDIMWRRQEQVLKMMAERLNALTTLSASTCHDDGKTELCNKLFPKRFPIHGSLPRD